MELPPLTRNYFSSQPNREIFFRRLCMFLLLTLTVFLYFFWMPLRDTAFTYSLVSLTVDNTAAYIFFRGVTTLGSEGFFLLFLSVIYWSVNKALGFWGLLLMPLAIFVTSEVPKDIIRLPRPEVRGVTVPTYTFPSGHTSGAVSVWGYLAIMIKRRWFWVASIMIMFLVGLSRTMLGYHFLGDVIGGIITGIVFLAVFFWLANYLMENNIAEKLTFSMLIFLALAVPLALSFIPALYAPNLMGYLAGAASGHLLERKNLNFKLQGNLIQHILRSLLGMVVIAIIVLGPTMILSYNFHLLTFIKHGLATFWATYLAPLVFIKTGLVRL